MTRSDALVADLVAAGFDAADALTRVALARTAADRLARVSRRSPVGPWFVPGRIEVIGKHTDYAGGRSIVAAVPRGMAILAAPRGDGLVRVIDARHDREVEIDPLDRGHARGGWPRYASAVLERFASNFPGADLGCDIAFASDLPRAAGMSSSSMLIVGIALAVAARAGLENRDEWRAAIGDEFALAEYFGAIENGSTFRTLNGAGGVGTQGGSQDHTAILTTRAGRLTLYRYRPVRRLDDAWMPADWRFAIMTSGVHASKAGSRRDDYNRAPREVAALVDLWHRETGGAPPSSLAAALDSRPDAADRLRRSSAGGHLGFTGEQLARRLAHFVDEDARAASALAAFRDADEDALAEVSRASQAAAAADLGNQVPETMALARVALDAGACASSSFGAGFGGSVWALVRGDAEAAARMTARWRDRYLAACPHIRDVEWLVTRPSPPVVRCT